MTKGGRNTYITIRGRFERYVHQYETTGESVFDVVPERTVDGIVNGLLRCKGKITLFAKGMPIELGGVVDNQNVMQVERAQIPSHTEDSVYRILEFISDRFTETQKSEIAKACGNDLFFLCSDESGLETLKKILIKAQNGDKLAHDIYRKVQSLSSGKALEELMSKYGVPFAKVVKMGKEGLLIGEIKKNPYLTFLRFDIPIQTADVFAQKECGIKPYDMIRIKGLICHTLCSLLSSGHTCFSLDQIEAAFHCLHQDILQGIHFGPAVINAGILDMQGICQYHEVDGECVVYMNHVWEEECGAVYHYKRLQQNIKHFQTSVSVSETEKALGIQYNEQQREAFQLLRTSGIKILTGPPGSGKTATVNGLIHNFEANKNGTVKLAATTGMAAKVLRASTNRDSETAHKMLHVLPYNNTIRSRDLNDPIEADLIVVDEVSMMGLQLFSALVQAVRNGSILLLVGDENQLQSVEYGNILHDLIRTGQIEICRLSKVLRQSGSIYINAARINCGLPEMMLDQKFHMSAFQGEGLYPQLLNDYDPYQSQIICPIKKGVVGVERLNQAIQKEVNGMNQAVATCGCNTYRYQDRVILTKTNYEAGYVNGDIGTIVDVTASGDLVLSYHGGILYIEKENFSDLDLAYAITIHKSQGSEFSKVHIVLPQKAGNMMTRRLVYTAVTRAKQEVFIYYEGGSFLNAVDNMAEQRRQTKLQPRLLAENAGI